MRRVVVVRKHHVLANPRPAPEGMTRVPISTWRRILRAVERPWAQGFRDGWDAAVAEMLAVIDADIQKGEGDVKVNMHYRNNIRTLIGGGPKLAVYEAPEDVAPSPMPARRPR